MCSIIQRACITFKYVYIKSCPLGFQHPANRIKVIRENYNRWIARNSGCVSRVTKCFETESYFMGTESHEGLPVWYTLLINKCAQFAFSYMWLLMINDTHQQWQQGGKQIIAIFSFNNRTGLRVTHVVLGGYLVPAGTVLVTIYFMFFDGL